MNTLLDVMFIIAGAFALAYGLNRRMNFGVAAYLGGYLVFALVLHCVWRIGARAPYDTDIYLFTHLVSFLFLAIVVALSVRNGRQNEGLLHFVCNIQPISLFVVFGIWILFQAYLFARYGVSGALSVGEGTAKPEDYSYFDSSALLLVNTFGSGAALAVAVRLGAQPAFAKNLLVMSSFAVFIAYSLGFGAAQAGGRRTVLILAICFLMARLSASRDSIMSVISKNIKQILVVTIVCLGMAWYYQSIRNNPFLPVVQRSLSAPGLTAKLDGVVLLLTPGLYERYAVGGDTSAVNRSGPFDLLYAILEARYQFGRSTDGELTIHSILKAIPKSFYPNKPDYDIDYIIAMRFGVVMGRNFAVSAEFFRAPDLSTTILATLIGDFGWPALGIAAVIVVLSLRACIPTMTIAPASAVVVIGSLGVMFDLISMIEGSLSTLLASLRTLAMLAGLGFVLRFAGLAGVRRRVPKRVA